MQEIEIACSSRSMPLPPQRTMIERARNRFTAWRSGPRRMTRLTGEKKRGSDRAE
jgi:hypothetical protein